MTEVRPIRLLDNNGVVQHFGLFATKSYNPGDVILCEEPLFIFGRLATTTTAKSVVTTSLQQQEQRQNNEDEVLLNSQFEVSSSLLTSFCTVEKTTTKKSENKSQSISINDVIPPNNNDWNDDVLSLGKFRGMVKVAAYYALFRSSSSNADDNDVTNKLKIMFNLYHPGPTSPENLSKDEKRIVDIAHQAMEYCIKYAKPKSELHHLLKSNTKNNHAKGEPKGQEELLKVMLIWSCNAFEGGMLYEKTSRVNHSCDPNCIIVHNGPTVDAVPAQAVGITGTTPPTPSSSCTNPKKMGSAATATMAGNDNSSLPSSSFSHSRQNNPTAITLRAATTIQPNDEITISYLGIITYAGRSARQERLRQTKHFACNCTRCQPHVNDLASGIPCPKCHVRGKTGGGVHIDDENVQYDDDDDGMVHYAYPVVRTESKGGDTLSTSAATAAAIETACSTTTTLQCSHCDCTIINDEGLNKKLMNATKRISEKVLSRILSLNGASFSPMPSPATEDKDDDDNDEEDNAMNVRIEEEMDERLYHLASSVLGAKHWCTNLMLLRVVNRQLSAFHACMLLGGSGSLDGGGGEGRKNDTNTTIINETDLAETIDNIQHIWSFIMGLKLKLHPGHLLSNPIIGLARVLVSLGDVKSKRYASEWIDRVADSYVNVFETETLKRVVHALRVAWEREEEAVTTTKKKNKKRNNDSEVEAITVGEKRTANPGLGDDNRLSGGGNSSSCKRNKSR